MIVLGILDLKFEPMKSSVTFADQSEWLIFVTQGVATDEQSIKVSQSSHLYLHVRSLKSVSQFP